MRRVPQGSGMARHLTVIPMSVAVVRSPLTEEVEARGTSTCLASESKSCS